MPPNAGERAKEIATAFATELGPRDHATQAGGAAQDWVERKLMARSWSPRRLQTWPGAVHACQRGETPQVVLFMAHTDTVPGVLGGNDNASSVGVLLAAAELLRGASTARTVCLAFPDAEEAGLRGSAALAEAARRGELGGPIDQAMSLDLVGVGALTHNGLGPPFGHRRLNVLLGAAPAQVPWIYRAVSHARPGMERSDHYWFTRDGIPASHLMARGPRGFDPAYHTIADTPGRLEPETLQAAVDAVVSVAHAPPMPPEDPGSPAFVIPTTSIPVPGWFTWLFYALSIGAWGAGLGPVPSRQELGGALAWLAQCVVATVVLGLAMFVALGFRELDGALIDPVCLAGWAAWGALALASPLETSPVIGRAIGGAVAIGLALWLAWTGAPLLGLPLAIAALGIGLSRWVPAAALLAGWPALYLFRPDGIRELDFHGLFPANVFWWTALAGLLLVPVMGGLQTEQHPHRRNVAAILAIVAVCCIVAAWIAPRG